MGEHTANKQKIFKKTYFRNQIGILSVSQRQALHCNKFRLLFFVSDFCPDDPNYLDTYTAIANFIFQFYFVITFLAGKYYWS